MSKLVVSSPLSPTLSMQPSKSCADKLTSNSKNGKTHGPVTAIYPGSRLHFFEVMKNVRWEDYDIDYVTGNRFQFFGNGFSQTEIDPDGDPVWYFDDDFVKV